MRFGVCHKQESISLTKDSLFLFLVFLGEPKQPGQLCQGETSK